MPPMSVNQALQLMYLHQKAALLVDEPTPIRRRKGESNTARNERLALMAEARDERAREAFEVAEAERMERGLPAWGPAGQAVRLGLNPGAMLPDLAQVTGWSNADPEKAPADPDRALFGGWRIGEMEQELEYRELEVFEGEPEPGERRRGCGGCETACWRCCYFLVCVRNVQDPFHRHICRAGGLSEGFSRLSSFTGSSTSFESQLAIEKDPVAVQTLRLRSFYRAFPEGTVPDAFYEVIRGQRDMSSLALFPEWATAERHVWNATLGEVDQISLHKRIDEALGGNRNWVLLGGPPCQAYSLMGRARLTGVGAAARENGENLDDLRKQGWLTLPAEPSASPLSRISTDCGRSRAGRVRYGKRKGILSSKLSDQNGGQSLVFDQISERSY
jgi:hypothetical protein